MKKNDHIESQQRLLHMTAAIDKIENYVVNESVITYCENVLLQDAILFQFSVLGEAINHVEKSKLEKYEYPWHKVRSFRNFIAHEYFNIKQDAVWEIVIKDLPKLKSVIAEILKKEF